MSPARRAPTAGESLKEYGRGVGGGFLFSIPLLYTMEVWWAGFTAAPVRLVAGLAATFLILCAYNAYAGLRYDSGAAEIAIDSVEELGLGLALAALLLLLLGRIGPDVPWMEALGKTVIEGMFVAIGVSVGTAQIGQRDDDAGSRHSRERTVGSEVALALCGAVLIAANIGPTEEILMLAAEARPMELLGLVLLSLVLALTLLYFSDFAGSEGLDRPSHLFGRLEGAAVTYATGLVAAAAILWFFGRFDEASLDMVVAQCVVLALPGTLGAAAGRLLLGRGR